MYKKVIIFLSIWPSNAINLESKTSFAWILCNFDLIYLQKVNIKVLLRHDLNLIYRSNIFIGQIYTNNKFNKNKILY